jgi:hypothetical protein
MTPHPAGLLAQPAANMPPFSKSLMMKPSSVYFQIGGQLAKSGRGLHTGGQDDHFDFLSDLFAGNGIFGNHGDVVVIRIFNNFGNFALDEKTFSSSLIFL